MTTRKNKRSDSGIADFTIFTQNLKVLRCYNLCKNAADFANKLKLKDGKRLAEVESGRLKPTKKEIEALIKLSGLNLFQLCRVKLYLTLNH